MTHISARNLYLHYPLLATPRPKISGVLDAGVLRKTSSKKYIEALRDISFEIKAGERVGLIGRNGSGKSSLLRILGGIYLPSAGEVTIQGEIASLFNINLGTQRDATGRQNIILRGIVKGLSRKQINGKMDEIIEFSDLGDFIDMPLRTYSAGMAMRLTFAIATSFSPEVLLLDEWIGAGDQTFQKKAADRMKELVNQSGITIIASHNRALLKKVCDVAIWLHKGVIRAHGPIDEVYTEMDKQVS